MTGYKVLHPTIDAISFLGRIAPVVICTSLLWVVWSPNQALNVLMTGIYVLTLLTLDLILN